MIIMIMRNSYITLKISNCSLSIDDFICVVLYKLDISLAVT